MKKLTYKQVVSGMRHISLYPGGVEYLIGEGRETDFIPKQIGRIEKEYRQMYREANRNLALWKKGVRVLIQMANHGPGAFAMMAKAYTGNGSSDNLGYFYSLYRLISQEDLITIGRTGEPPMITSYVDGSYDYYL